MVTVHDGTANINIRNVINVKCVNCKNCIGFENGYYFCYLAESFEMVEECIANDENVMCELYVPDSDDDITKRA